MSVISCRYALYKHLFNITLNSIIRGRCMMDNVYDYYNYESVFIHKRKLSLLASLMALCWQPHCTNVQLLLNSIFNVFHIDFR